MKMKFALLSLLALALVPFAVHAQSGPQLSAIIYNSNANPCQSGSVVKSSAVVNISSATTTALVTSVSGKITFVCGFYSTVVGTSPTLVFKTGTQVSAACDTSPVAITGTFAPTSGSVLNMSHGATLFQSASGGQICATTGGTGPSVQGVIVFVQQ